MPDMFEDLRQRGNQTAATRSIYGLIGSLGFFLIFYFDIFNLGAGAFERWKWVVLVMCAAAALASTVNLVRSKNVSLMKGIENYCAKSNDPEAMLDRMKQVWETGLDHGAGKIDAEYIILILGLSSKVIPLGDALWAYKKVTQDIGRGTYTHLFVCYDQHQYHSAAISPAAVETILAYILKNCPGVAVGYSAELDRFYSEMDVQGFREYASNQRNARDH